MNNACPGCGAVYAVAEKDIGRRIACKKCSASLIVAEDGLRYDESAAASPPAPERDRGRDRDDDDRGGRKRRDRDSDRDRGREETDEEREARRARRAAATNEVMNKLKSIGDVATWLYAIGLVLVIYAKYSTEIDEAKHIGRVAKAQEEEYDKSVKIREIDAKREEEKREPKDEEKKQKEEIEKDWKKRSNDLLDDIKSAEYGKDRGKWWTQVFKLFGMIILAFGAIGYLKAEQTPLKRILGGVTILLILAQVVGGFPLFR